MKRTFTTLLSIAALFAAASVVHAQRPIRNIARNVTVGVRNGVVTVGQRVLNTNGRVQTYQGRYNNGRQYYNGQQYNNGRQYNNGQWQQVAPQQQWRQVQPQQQWQQGNTTFRVQNSQSFSSQGGFPINQQFNNGFQSGNQPRSGGFPPPQNNINSQNGGFPQGSNNGFNNSNNRPPTPPSNSGNGFPNVPFPG